MQVIVVISNGLTVIVLRLHLSHNITVFNFSTRGL